MKRILDLIIAIPLLIILSPFLLLISLLIRLESSGPALFRQERVGKNRKRFTCYKFRTMRTDTPDIASNNLSNRDQYMTGVGNILRKYSLDELPQLLNIIRGEMSIVGPRPVIPEEERLVNLRANHEIYELKPGVTGWAQINGRDHVTIEKKVKLDAYYHQHLSLWLDIKIILFTFSYVLRKKGVIEHSGEVKTEQSKQETAATREKSS